MVIGIFKKSFSFFFFVEIMFIETSAATSENVTESFLQCARVILSKIESGIFSF